MGRLLAWMKIIHFALVENVSENGDFCWSNVLHTLDLYKRDIFLISALFCYIYHIKTFIHYRATQEAHLYVTSTAAGSKWASLRLAADAAYHRNQGCILKSHILWTGFKTKHGLCSTGLLYMCVSL